MLLIICTGIERDILNHIKGFKIMDHTEKVMVVDKKAVEEKIKAGIVEVLNFKPNSLKPRQNWEKQDYWLKKLKDRVQEQSALIEKQKAEIEEQEKRSEQFRLENSRNYVTISGEHIQELKCQVLETDDLIFRHVDNVKAYLNRKKALGIKIEVLDKYEIDLGDNIVVIRDLESGTDIDKDGQPLEVISEKNIHFIDMGKAFYGYEINKLVLDDVKLSKVNQNGDLTNLLGGLEANCVEINSSDIDTNIEVYKLGAGNCKQVYINNQKMK